MLGSWFSAPATFVFLEQVALKLWLYQNVEAVVSMYEDRFDLCTFQSQLIEKPSRDQRTENHSWWKNLTQRKSGPMTSASSYIKIMSISIPVKRTKELRALKGWYASSLCLSLACMYITNVTLWKHLFMTYFQLMKTYCFCMLIFILDYLKWELFNKSCSPLDKAEDAIGLSVPF